MDLGPSSGFLSGLFNNPNVKAGFAQMGQNMPGLMQGNQPNQQGIWGQVAGKLGKKMGQKNQPMGTNPSAGSPNNPFGNIQFGSSPMGSGGIMGPGGNTGFTGGMPSSGMMGGGLSPLWGNYQQMMQRQQPPAMY